MGFLNQRSCLKLFRLVPVFILVGQLISASVPLAQISQWSSPEIIPGISLDSYPPILVVDENRTVHAFSSQWVGATDPIKAIEYTQWTLEHGWSVPIDIVISPINEARVTSAYLDKKGMMHLAYFGGNGTSGDIYYTRAPAKSVGNARSWSSPILVGEDAGDPEGAVLVGDGQEISIVYHGKSDGNGVYVVTTKDDGNTWSDPLPIYLSDSESPYIYGIHVVESKSGWLHAIWNVYSRAGQGRGIYYARSKSGETQWSDPVLLATALDGLGTQTPNIIEHDSVIFAVFNLPPKITMRLSLDNGITWGDPVVIFPRHVGVNGSLSLVVDGNNTLHLLFGQRITGNPDIHGMWHSIWLGSRWTEPDAVIKGPRVIDKNGLTGFDPYEARAVVSQGNVLLITWRTDPGDIRDNGVWYSYSILNASELPVATLQSEDTFISPVPSNLEVLQSPTETAGTQIVFDRKRDEQSPLVWAGLALVFIGILRVLYMLFDRGR